jgi:hypothetical protein
MTRKSRATSRRSFKCALGLSLSPVLALVITPNCHRPFLVLVPPVIVLCSLPKSTTRSLSVFPSRRGQIILTSLITGSTRLVRVLTSVFCMAWHTSALCVWRFPFLRFSHSRRVLYCLVDGVRTRSPLRATKLAVLPSRLALRSPMSLSTPSTSPLTSSATLPPPRGALVVPRLPRRRDSSAVLDCRLIEACARVRRLTVSQRLTGRPRHARSCSRSGHSSRCPLSSSSSLSPHFYRPRMRSAVPDSLSSAVPGPRCAGVD